MRHQAKTLITSLGLALALFAAPACAQTTQCIASAAAQGTPNAITIAALPCALTTNLLILTAAGANTSTTPTLQPLGLPAQTIVRPDGTALALGDISGVGYKALLNPTGSVWVLLNPATTPSGSLEPITPGVLGYAGVGTGIPSSLTTLPSNLTLTGVTIFGNATSVIAPGVKMNFGGATNSYGTLALDTIAGSVTNSEYSGMFILDSSVGSANPLTAAKVALGAEGVGRSGSAGVWGFVAVVTTQLGFSASHQQAAEFDSVNQTGNDCPEGDPGSSQLYCGGILVTGGSGNKINYGVMVQGSLTIDDAFVCAGTGTGVLVHCLLTYGTETIFIDDEGSHAIGLNGADGVYSTAFILGPGSTSSWSPTGAILATALRDSALTIAGSVCNSATGVLSTTTGRCTGSDPSDVTSVSNSDGTLTISPTTGAVVASLALGHANTWTGVQTFTNSDLALLGSSTGKTIFTSANAGASNFTVTVPAATDTIDLIAQAQTLTNKTISGALNTLSNIANASLSNSSVTIGSTNIALGATVTTFAGLTSVTSTTFVGALTGHASLDLALTGGTITGGVNYTATSIFSGTSTSYTPVEFNDTNTGGQLWAIGPGVGAGTPGSLNIYNLTGSNIVVKFGSAGGMATTSHVTATSAAPSISSCGTGSPAVTGGDNFGKITAGGGVLASCVVNFGTTWGAAPACTVSSPTAVASLTVTTSTTQITIGGTSLTSDVLSYVCGSTASLEPANDNFAPMRYRRYA